MKIFLNNYKIRPRKALKVSGYKYRENEGDFLRSDEGRGRFHAKILDAKTIDIHYDLFVENRHWSPDLPLHHINERKRIIRRIAFSKFRELNEEEWQHLQDKW